MGVAASENEFGNSVRRNCRELIHLKISTLLQVKLVIAEHTVALYLGPACCPFSQLFVSLG